MLWLQPLITLPRAWCALLHVRVLDASDSSPKLTSLSFLLNLLPHLCGIIFHPALGLKPPLILSFLFISHPVLLLPSMKCLQHFQIHFHHHFLNSSPPISLFHFYNNVLTASSFL